MNKDLTIGNPDKTIWKFCLPLFLSVIFQQAYNLADSIVAGRFISETAMSSISNSYEITLIFLAIAVGCNVGCSVVVSRLFGSKSYSQLKSAIYTTFISSLAICFVLTILGLAFSEKILLLIKTPADIINDSKNYLNIYLYGLIFVFFYNISTGIFTALGDSKTPFMFLACSSVSNIFLDVIFVIKLDLGVSGIALATLICQCVSCILAMITLINRLKYIIITEKAKIFSLEILKDISKIAIPSMLQQSFISVGNVFIQSLVNSFGPSVIAGFGGAIKLNSLVLTSLTTIGNGVSTFTAQNMGAKKYERISLGCSAGIKFVYKLVVPFVILYLVLGKNLLHIFILNPSETALSSGGYFLRIVSPFYLVVATKLVMDGILKGKKLMNEFMIATFSDLILRVLLAFILSKYLHETGIWMSWPLGWIVGTLLSIYFYRKSQRKLPKKLDLYPA